MMIIIISCRDVPSMRDAFIEFGLPEFDCQTPSQNQCIAAHVLDDNDDDDGDDDDDYAVDDDDDDDDGDDDGWR